MSKKLRQLICVVAAAGACGVLLTMPANARSGNRGKVTPDNAPAATPQQQPAAKPPQQAPEAETKEAMKVQAAADAAARLQAAGEFVKKYPKSTLRPQVAGLVLEKFNDVKDDAQQITLAENYLTVFNEPTEAEQIQPFAIDAYVRANRHADAFRVAAVYLARNPEAVGILTQLSLHGIDQARRGNAQFVDASRQYGIKAIELIEADKKPASFDDARWAEYKTKWLPQLQQYLAVLAYTSKNTAEALARLEKAAALNPADAFNYLMISDIQNVEYQRLAEEYKAAPAGAGKDELLKKGQAQMDKVIDAYAHALALSEGSEQYKQVREQMMADLTSYYKYRHNNSVEGMQQLIDKYKTPKP